MLRAAFVITALVFSCSWAHAQGYQCRTSSPGTSSAYCASEAFVTKHFPSSSTAGHVATFADTSGNVLQDGGAAPGTVTEQKNTAGNGLTTSGNCDNTSTNASNPCNYAAAPSFWQGFLGGLTLSNDGGTPNSVLDISAGVAVDSTNAAFIKIGAFTKSTAGAWTSGSGQNGMGNGLTIANGTWYHVCLANNSGSADIWFDTSATCANRPSGITDPLYRRIGSFKTGGSAQIIAFTQNGDEVLWKTTIEDVSGATATTVAALKTITVPPGIEVWALLAIEATLTSGSPPVWLVYPPDMGTQAANSVSGWGDAYVNSTTVSALIHKLSATRTNVSAQVGLVASLINANANISIVTEGYIDRRGRDN